jgi:hypothetical protein
MGEEENPLADDDVWLPKPSPENLGFFERILLSTTHIDS